VSHGLQTALIIVGLIAAYTIIMVAFAWRCATIYLRSGGDQDE
jgi:hypothetical protein